MNTRTEARAEAAARENAVLAACYDLWETMPRKPKARELARRLGIPASSLWVIRRRLARAGRLREDGVTPADREPRPARPAGRFSTEHRRVSMALAALEGHRIGLAQVDVIRAVEHAEDGDVERWIGTIERTVRGLNALKRALIKEVK